MQSTFTDKIVRDSFGCPGQLCETGMDFLVQKLDTLLEQTSLLMRQIRNYSENIEIIYQKEEGRNGVFHVAFNSLGHIVMRFAERP